MPTFTFQIPGLPPVKDSATSLWARQGERVIALRAAARRALADTPPLARDLRLRLVIHLGPEATAPTPDLDNMVAGILDGLQAAPRGAVVDDAVWAQAPADIAPTVAVGVQDDAYVVAIQAEKAAAAERTWYSVELSGSWVPRLEAQAAGAGNGMGSALAALYERTGLFRCGAMTYAPAACAQAAACWAGEPDHRFPPRPPAEKGSAYRPWVGHSYPGTRLVVVGENFHGHGGLEAAVEIVRWAKPKLAAGRRRLHFDAPGYHGSLFQHRAALYAQVWLATAHDTQVPIGQVYDHIAFTNLVKCSPRPGPDSRSTPNEVMWRTCAALLLVRELEILGARRVVVLGRSSNAAAFRAQVWPALALAAVHERVELWRDPDGREALVVPHPASPGGAAWSIAQDVRSVVQKGSHGAG